VAGIDQHHLQAVLFEDLVDRDPIDSGRFHRHGLNPTSHQPLGQPLQIGGEGAELAHRLGVAVGRDCDEMALLSTVDTGRVGLDAFEQ
jgi:hypothetical protein